MTLVIDKYSHHFAIVDPNTVYVSTINQFAKDYLLQVSYYKTWNNTVVQQSAKMFAVKRKEPILEFRFHLSHLPMFLDYMASKGFNDVTISEHGLYAPAPAHFNLVTDKQPRDDQPLIIDYLTQPGSKKVIELQAGQGKSCINGTPVKTPNGWTNIEDLKVGDLVMGETAEYHNVTGVYPQGKDRPLYKFTFKDGRTAIVDESHLWQIEYQPSRFEKAVTTVTNTLEIMGFLDKGYSVSIPTIDPVNKDSVLSFKEHIANGGDPDKQEYLKQMMYSIGYGRIGTNGDYVKKPCLFISSVEKLPYTGETTCISVDNPTRLFVIKDYIVTHNTFCALMAVQQMGERAILIIKPMYIQRWLDDLTKSTGIFNLSKHEITVIRGSQQLATVLRMGLEGTLPYKFIILSNKTLALYYKDYLTGVSMDKYCGVTPDKLMEVLKIGVRIIDEAHQDFHQCFKTDLFSHVPKTIELSATLEPDDQFLKKMYQAVYPMDTRFGGGKYKKYVDVISVPYRIDTSINAPIRYNQKGRMSYSHGSVEESIMKNKKRLNNYIDMVLDLAKKYFINKRYKDFKLLIFANRVDMCRLIVEALKPVYPNLNITKYTEEEDYTILEGMDIIVSTPISAGTAVDIPNLQVVINTVAIGSTQANLQMIGRLRELRGADVNPTFIYTYCKDIEKHVEYHIKKRDHTFNNRVVSYTDLYPIIYSV